jgi:two-component system, NarL family, sensor kinase
MKIFVKNNQMSFAMNRSFRCLLIILIFIPFKSIRPVESNFKQEEKTLDQAEKFSSQFQFDSAIYYYDLALKEAIKKENNELQIAYINKQKGTGLIYLGQLDSALVYLGNAKQIAEQIKNDTIHALTNLNIGYIMFKQGKTDLAETLFNQSLEQYESVADTIGMAKAYNLLTILYKYTGDFDKGIGTALKACYYFERLDQIPFYTRSLINLGNIYEKLGEYDTAYSCYQICKNISLELGIHAQALKTFINMAVIDFDNGIKLDKEGKKEEAIKKYLKSKENYLEAITISKELNDNESLSLCYSNISAIFRIFSEGKEAINSSKEALSISTALGDMNGQVHALKNLGLSYILVKNYQKAKDYLIQSLDLARIAKHKEDQKEILKSLSELYEKMGDYNTALSYHRLAAAMQDSILDDEKVRAIKENEARFELMHLRDQNKIKELEKKKIRFERNLSFGIGITIIVLLVLLIIFFRMRARKNRIIAAQRIQKLEDEKKLMAARSVLVGQEKERERIAHELHDGIGVLLSTASIHFSSVESKANKETGEMLKKANQLLKEAGKEVRQISHNMMPGVLSKFGLKEAIEDLFEDIEEAGNLKVDLALTCGDERLAENMEIMIFRVVQEMLNNTLKHAEASKISLYISRGEDEIIIDFVDDGKGFEEEKLQLNKNLGLSGIRSRIEYLGGTIELISHPGKGTSYTISIPLSEKLA